MREKLEKNEGHHIAVIHFGRNIFHFQACPDGRLLVPEFVEKKRSRILESRVGRVTF